MLFKLKKISFIVAIYNKVEYIKECLDSILSQEISKEIICVDDYSTDGTYEILLEYEKKYKEIKVIRNDENKGLIITRLVGLRKATGQYAMLVDADDSLIDNIIFDIYKKAIDNKIDIVEFGYRVIKDSETKDVVLENKEIKSKLYKNYVDHIIINNLWNKIYSKKIYKFVVKNIPLNIKIDDYSDPILFLYMFLKNANGVLQVDTIGYNYYMNRTGMTVTDSMLKHFYHYCDFKYTYDFLKSKLGYSMYLDKTKNSVCNQAVSAFLKLKKKEQNLSNRLCMKKIMTEKDIEYLIDFHTNKKD